MWFFFFFFWYGDPLGASDEGDEGDEDPQVTWLKTNMKEVSQQRIKGCLKTEAGAWPSTPWEQKQVQDAHACAKALAWARKQSPCGTPLTEALLSLGTMTQKQWVPQESRVIWHCCQSRWAGQCKVRNSQGKLHKKTTQRKQNQIQCSQERRFSK